MKASKCPVCEGSGWGSAKYQIRCHGCDGRGWIEVSE